VFVVGYQIMSTLYLDM